MNKTLSFKIFYTRCISYVIQFSKNLIFFSKFKNSKNYYLNLLANMYFFLFEQYFLVLQKYFAIIIVRYVHDIFL